MRKEISLMNGEIQKQDVEVESVSCVMKLRTTWCSGPDHDIASEVLVVEKR